MYSTGHCNTKLTNGEILTNYLLHFRLWPNESAGVFDSVARIPYTDLMNDNPYVDPFVLHSMKTFGFFYVVDVPDYSAETELELMTTFFGLPEDVKADVEIRAHNPANPNAYRGNIFRYTVRSQVELTTVLFKN